MPWFNLVTNEAEPKKATVQILDQIGYDWWSDTGTEAAEFMKAVRDLGDRDEVLLEINSPGGNVHGGVSIANFIRSHSATWTAKVLGEASSIASVIACACDRREMGVGTIWLAHKPLTALLKLANATEFRNLADTLDTIEESIMDFYLPLIEAKGKTKEELSAYLEEDRIMTAKEALEWGFVDHVDANIPAVNSSMSHQCFENASLRMLMEQKDSEIKSLKEKPITVEALNSISITEETLPQVKAWASAFNFDLVNAEQEDPAVIAQSCQEAGIAGMTHSFIQNKVSKRDFKRHLECVAELQTICAAANIGPEEVLKHYEKPEEMVRIAIQNAVASAEPEQDPHISSGKGDQSAPVLDTSAIYARRNKR